MDLLQEVTQLLTEVEKPYEETDEQLAPYFDVIASSSFSSALLIRTLNFKEFERVSSDFREIIRDAVSSKIYQMGFSFLHPKSKRKMRKLIFSLIFDIPITTKDYTRLFKHDSKIILPASERLRLLTKGEDIAPYTFLSKKEEGRLLFPVRLLAYYYVCSFFCFHDRESTLIKQIKYLLSLMEEEAFSLGRKEFFDLSTDSYIPFLTNNPYTQQALKKEFHRCYKRNRNDWDPFIHPPTPKIDKHNVRKFVSIEGYSGLDRGEAFFYFKRTCLPEQKEIDSYKEIFLLKCQQRLDILKNQSLEKKDQFHLKELKQQIESIYNWKAIE